GYQVAPASPQTVPDVAPGHSATVRWTVAVPADPVPAAQLVHHATFTADGDQAEGVSTISTLDVPADSLAALFDNAGVTDDTATDAGNFDGAGSSLSAQALAAAGVTPGGSIRQFSWPSALAGQPDNVAAGGQALRVNATGTSLSFLTAAT